MGWLILIGFVFLLLMGFASIFGSEEKTSRSDSDQRSENDDDQMLEDWYTSQELDNDLDDWDQ
jgi:hypothetical protein